MMPSRTFTITPQQVTTFRQSLAAHDIPCPAGNQGQILTGWGIVLGFDYDGFANLTITIVKTGWASEDRIWEDIAKYMG